MKTHIRKFGLDINFCFSCDRVKRMVFDIPDWADDTHLRQGSIGEWGTSDGKTKVVFFKGSQMTELPVPDCKRSVEVSLTPMWDKKTRTRMQNRKIVVDLFF